MNTTIPTLTLLASAFAATAAFAELQPVTAADPLVVHEWGTFTSMQGSDGLVLEGLHHEEETLPGFVHSRVQGDVETFRRPPTKGLPRQPIVHVTQKMETPVVYFHTKTGRRVHLAVDLTGGLMTQWYPAVTRVTPEALPMEDGAIDPSRAGKSTLEWDVDVAPATARSTASFPKVSADEPWGFAREVDAAPVRVVAKEGSVPAESEKYLFYRGLGAFGLPMKISAVPEGTVAVTNGGALAVPAVLVAEVKFDTARFQVAGSLAAKSSVTVALGAVPFREKATVMNELRQAVTRALLAQGLFADEAEAMVRTWSRQWFASEGTRVLYLVPQPVVEELLPMRISPAPAKLVRVLLGRLEYLTPEHEASVAQALAARASAEPVASKTAGEGLGALGRFVEPNVRRILAQTTDEQVRRSAQELLEMLR